MALVTIQVLDGADRGRVFENLATPVTIGREEGNSIQLNPEPAPPPPSPQLVLLQLLPLW